MKYQCGYCMKYYSTLRHEELEELRAHIVNGIYLTEAELARKKNSPRLFLDDKFLKKLRRQLEAINKELKEIDDGEFE